MGRKTYQNIGLLLVGLFFFATACKRESTPEPKAPPTDVGSESVYVLCEGSLGSGNATLWLQDTKSNVVYENVYQTANNEQLGDILQSMTAIGDKLFLCVNNSDKIVVLNKSDRKKIGTINVSKPRYILPISATKAYVSSIFSNTVHIINPQTLTVEGAITMPAKNPEAMVLSGNKAYICTWDTSCRSLYAIDTATDQITGTIPIAGAAPQAVVTDGQGYLWVMSGNVAKGKSAALTQIDPTSEKTLKSFQFPAKADPIKPVFDGSGSTLYFIEVNYNGETDNNGIYRMNITDNALPSAPFIQAKELQYFWGLGYDQQNDRIYVGDPKGFIQKGSVYVYDKSGAEVNKFDVGLGPGFFYFDK